MTENINKTRKYENLQYFFLGMQVCSLVLYIFSFISSNNFTGFIFYIYLTFMNISVLLVTIVQFLERKYEH